MGGKVYEALRPTVQRFLLEKGGQAHTGVGKGEERAAIPKQNSGVTCGS